MVTAVLPGSKEEPAVRLLLDSNSVGNSDSSSSSSSTGPKAAASTSTTRDKVGNLHARVRSVTPVGNITASGDLFVRHGKLFNISLACDGSGPWTYCYHGFKVGKTVVQRTVLELCMRSRL